MRRFMLFVGLMLLLVIGGGLTALLVSSANGTILPVLTQTINPDASRSIVLPWKAEQVFFLVGFIVFNLVGIAVTLAIIFWFVDRGVRRNAQVNQPARRDTTVTTG